jgi:hypothetical protein
MSRLETEFIKQVTSVQLGDNLFNGALHLTWTLKKAIEFPVRLMQRYTYFWATIYFFLKYKMFILW